ncbi:MAG: methyltransferase domain-containing protein [Opitutaceae bacterium]
MSTTETYEQSARYYDTAHEVMKSLGPDAKFYRDLAVESGGPVLELGCGTGRVLLPIAERGVACAGVDLSPAMLEQFRRKAGAEAVALTCAPMESFALGAQRFPLIFSAFRAFQHLDTVDQQLACLACVRAHLEPGGAFAFDVFNPKLERMALASEPETMDLAFTYDGRPAKRFTSVTRDRVNQIMHVTNRYVEETTSGSTETIVHFTMRWFWRYELEHLLRRAGFDDVTIHGDFDRSPLGQNSPAFVVVAR